MTPHETIIILCGGSLNARSLPVGTNTSNAMVPVNGRPVIAWILDDLIQKGQTAATIVLRAENERLRLFLSRAYEKRIDITVVPTEREGSILDSLRAGLENSNVDGPVAVLLGDTLITDSFGCAADFIYVGEVDDASRWCVVTTNDQGQITRFTDKQEIPGSGHLAAAGYYHFVDGRHLRDSVIACLADDCRELSNVLDRYAKERPIEARIADHWHDFGHIDNFTRAKQALLPSRFFNSLRVNPVLNTITKVSTDNLKLEDELAWYLDLPEELKVLTPRIVSQRRIAGSLEIVQEYYGYPTLAELFLYSDLPVDAWRSILRRVLGIHAEFRRYGGEVAQVDVVDMYLSKTTNRLRRLSDADEFWAKQLASTAAPTLNGQALRSLPELLEILEGRVEELSRSAVPGVVHGDLCFSNILFDFNNQIIRLIDPRGRFGRQGIYGDVRYDIAKLRHSVSGLYDFIVADMFHIELDERGATAEVFADATARTVSSLFDGMIASAGYDLRDIQVIEGLLFLSMLPLHHGHRRRQQMMYYTGMQLLSEAL
jgi:dTDP-glucose pyrophosphorylase